MPVFQRWLFLTGQISSKPGSCCGYHALVKRRVEARCAFPGSCPWRAKRKVIWRCGGGRRRCGGRLRHLPGRRSRDAILGAHIRVAYPALTPGRVIHPRHGPWGGSCQTALVASPGPAPLMSSGNDLVFAGKDAAALAFGGAGLAGAASVMAPIPASPSPHLRRGRRGDGGRRGAVTSDYSD